MGLRKRAQSGDGNPLAVAWGIVSSVTLIGLFGDAASVVVDLVTDARDALRDRRKRRRDRRS